jgi:gliding motility-associated-like protein
VCGTTYAMAASITALPGSWSAPAGAQVSDASDAHTDVSVANNGSYTFLWTVGSGYCSATDTVVINFHNADEPIWANAGEDQVLDLETTTDLLGSASPNSNTAWSVASGAAFFSDASSPQCEASSLAVGDNLLVLQASYGAGCPVASDTVLITVHELFIPQGFSPNGDGSNDSFHITGLAAFPQADIRVFDRWGQEVWTRAPYTNDWTGLSNNGEPLPNDTYFYVLNLSTGRTYNGFVVIKR